MYKNVLVRKLFIVSSICFVALLSGCTQEYDYYTIQFSGEPDIVYVGKPFRHAVVDDPIAIRSEITYGAVVYTLETITSASIPESVLTARSVSGDQYLVKIDTKPCNFRLRHMSGGKLQSYLSPEPAYSAIFTWWYHGHMGFGRDQPVPELSNGRCDSQFLSIVNVNVFSESDGLVVSESIELQVKRRGYVSEPKQL